tara:strand:+ start:2131 stop:2451 length:321 start_codon:yes stop_codon:yes gene_type:complete
MKFLYHSAALEAAGFKVTVDNVTTQLGDVLAAFDPYGSYWCVDPAVQEILSGTVVPEAVPKTVSEPIVVEKVRARTDAGHFVKDDPATEKNEAWTTKAVKKLKKKK